MLRRVRVPLIGRAVLLLKEGGEPALPLDALELAPRIEPWWQRGVGRGAERSTPRVDHGYPARR